MGMIPPRLLRPQRTYAGEVCPDCGYPMDYSINQTCGYCGTFHLLPFDSLLIGPNWKPDYPYDAKPRPFTGFIRFLTSFFVSLWNGLDPFYDAKSSISEYMEPYTPTYSYEPQTYTPLLEDDLYKEGQ